MASKSRTKIWSGVTVKESIDTKTGKMTLKSRESLELAHSDTNDWVIDDSTSFTRLYNNANARTSLSDRELSIEEFEGVFYRERSTFDLDRADILNNRASYTDINQNQITTTQLGFFTSGIPGMVNPSSKQQVTTQGGVTNGNPDGVDPQSFESSSNFTRSAVGRVGNNRSLRGRSSFSGSASMRYPIGRLPDLGYDFIQFEVYDYLNKGQLAVRDAEERLGGKLETITLPMVGNLSDSSGVDWGGDKLNEIQRLAGQSAMGAIDGLSKGDFKAAGEAFTRTFDDIKTQASADNEIRRGIAAYFAGQAVGANLLTRGTGNVLNPNLELLFTGPQLRAFNFSFKLRPRSPEESQMIRAIIRTFKRSMAARREGSSFFLQTPHVFKIKYILNNGEEHPYMNRIKPCALTNFGVSYTPDGSYMTYDDGGLTGYDVNMTFGELTPIYADDQEQSEGMGY